jgi:hypothetical protein
MLSSQDLNVPVKKNLTLPRIFSLLPSNSH